MKRRLEEIQVFNFPRRGGGMVIPSFSPTLYVDTVRGNDGRDGFDHRHPLKTMGQAFARATQIGEMGQRIEVQGTITEQLIAPRVDNLSIVALSRSTIWQGPAAPAAATPLLRVRNQGLRLENFTLVPEADYYSVLLDRDAGLGYDASRFAMIGCQNFVGLGALADDGGSAEVHLDDNIFLDSTVSAIELLALDVATPARWLIERNQFFGNASHILASLSQGTIRENLFGTVAAAGLYVDLDQLAGTQGKNIVSGNILGGVYAAADYNAHATDTWAGNFTVAGITAALPV